MKVLIIIPARYKSSRLPGKPLKKIKGKELILRVIEKCKKIIGKQVGLIVATDNEQIHKLVKDYGYKSLMTSKKCLTGTDRVAEVARKISANIYINVQGDEPLINPLDIKKIIKAKIKNPNKVICGYTDLNKDERVENINIPKLVLNKKKELIYMSRSQIPGFKNKKSKAKYFKQVCIYAFNKKELLKFNSTKKTYLENLEDIEILRFLEKGYKILMVKLKTKIYAVDTKADLKKIQKYFN